MLGTHCISLVCVCNLVILINTCIHNNIYVDEHFVCLETQCITFGCLYNLCGAHTYGRVVISETQCINYVSVCMHVWSYYTRSLR